MSEKIYWVYILLCSNQSFYTGYTDNLEKRFQAHLSGKGSKYTRSFKPILIAQSWQIKGNKTKALRIERYIKTLSKAQKEELVQNPNSELLINLLNR
ncbi:GIY-YIG nuclease family protein [Fluoribacter gormanii]|uniref:Endonuclease n=1 Tax=Fluoribacter gormanii TaxID=464 RepID=A0A377GHM0_9GAMM|nr:GIY-YIG nuclease family protein [Fluoribacter gormanii]KTD01340.1 nuclease [Fluoribacter gormanii]MCW8444164.1 GIY-YIG nuclease family protein [Fluoribacter gormanii]MCW8469347.1 GIY-YIG nuclease family protein [Fluoribacter gormanii]SIR90394.1 putative endonuclease [Fluoribacter gormanii]STO24271.1 GIY-YIG nuclease superfamily protein [Fluoribacter gormanii]